MLEKINSPKDLKRLDVKKLEGLAKEIRELMVEVTSKKGGHLASSLGAVELTLALHFCFNTPFDKIVWDVGHQTYAHKIITGRKDRFHTLRQLGGISGFPKTEESEYDTFNVGHSSTSIAAACGMAVARDLKGGKEKVVAVVGDGSLSSGIAYEGLNNAGILDTDIIVVLNDNNMSISPSLGAISTYLSKKMTGPIYNKLRDEIERVIKSLPIPREPTLKLARKIEESFKFFSPGLLFEELGFKYFGPVNSEKLEDLIKVLNNVKKLHGPVLVHVLTKKGKGYKPAEENPSVFHGVGPFNIKTGSFIKKEGARPSYSTIFSECIKEEMSKNKRIIAITAAMSLGTGLETVKEQYPDRVFDVGIAEQYAVTFAAGLAISGMKPVVAIYSTFLQRAYDQIIHDVALQNLPVLFAIDRAGIVGEDGETHQGIFDISYLSCIPNMVVSAPKDSRELKAIIQTGLNYDGPFAVRYPRGESEDFGDDLLDSVQIGKWQTITPGNDVAILAVGSTVRESIIASEQLRENGISTEVVNARFIKPLDEKYLSAISRFKAVVTVEENVKIGGFGSQVAQYLLERGIHVPFSSIALPDKYIEHGTMQQLRKIYGLTSGNISRVVKSLLSR